jgi:hypothetical protein
MSTGIVAKVRNISTPRLDAMGGAGVGAILMDEATILNPAPLAFFNKTSFYYQKSDGELVDYSGGDKEDLKKPASKLYAITDTKARLKGGFRYSYQSEYFFSRKQISVALSHRVAEKSSLGIIYHRNKEKIGIPNTSFAVEEYSSFDVGVTHLLLPNVFIGILIQDIGKKHIEDNITTMGLQWIYKNFITINSDILFNYNGELSDTFGYRVGLQILFVKELYLRVGYFDDKARNVRGTGVGVSWTAPRFKLDFSIKNSKFKNVSYVDISNFKLKESSFSISFYF